MPATKTPSTKLPAATCKRCGGTEFEQRGGKIIRRDIPGIDEETGTEYRAIEWIPVKCANPNCRQFRKIRTLITAHPKKKAATSKATPKAATTQSKNQKRQKSAPTFVHLDEISTGEGESIVSIPATTQASDYSPESETCPTTPPKSASKTKSSSRASTA
jgi:hypothetical protein